MIGSSLAEGTPRGFWPIAVVSLLLVTGSNIVAPSLPVFASSFGVTNESAGLAIGAFALGRVFFDFFGGRMTVRYGFRAVAVAGCLISAVGGLVAAFTPDFAVLVASRIIQGAGSAIYITSALHEIVRLANREGVGKVVGTYQSVFMLGLIVGPLIGGAIASFFGYRAPFVLYAAFAILGGVFSYFSLSSDRRRVTPHEPSPQVRAEPKRWVRPPAALIGAVVITLGVYSVRSGVRNAILPLYADADLGWTEGMIGVLLGAIALGNVVVLQHAGAVVDRRGRRFVALASTGAMALTVMLFVVGQSTWWLLPVGVGFGAAMGYAGVAPAVIAADVTSMSNPSDAIGAQRTAMDLGLFVGPIILGRLADATDYTSAILVSGLFLVAVVVLFARFSVADATAGLNRR